MKYKVEVTETLQRIIEVEADSIFQAVEAVANDYSRGEIVLDSMDFIGYDIKEYQE